MIYDWNHDGLQQLTGASRTGALKSTLHLWSPPLQFPRHCVKCGINRLVSKPALSSNMGFRLILLHHIGSSYCVAVHMREMLSSSGPGRSASKLRRVEWHSQIDPVDANQLWHVSFQQRAADETLRSPSCLGRKRANLDPPISYHSYELASLSAPVRTRSKNARRDISEVTNIGL